MSAAEGKGASMTVAVTGATGFVGRHVVRALRDRGHAVRALARDPDKAGRLLPHEEGLEIVVGDVMQRRAMDRLLEGADATVHLIGIRREFPPKVTFQHLHIDATRKVVEAAQRAGARRFLHMSALGTRSEARSAYHRSKHAAECIVRDSGLDWTIFRPSVILGADGEFVQMAIGWATGETSPGVFMPYFRRWISETTEDSFVQQGAPSASVQPVLVSDVASAFAAALERPDSVEEIYPIGGPGPLTWPQLLQALRDAISWTDAKKPIIGVPPEAAVAAATIAGAVGLGTRLPFTVDDVWMATEDSVCSTAKAEADLGFLPSMIEFDRLVNA